MPPSISWEEWLESPPPAGADWIGNGIDMANGRRPGYKFLATWLQEQETTSRLTEDSLRGYRAVLTRWIRLAPPDPKKWSKRHVLKWLETPKPDGKELAPTSKRAYLSRLRAFCQWLKDTRRIDRDPTLGIASPRSRPGLPRPLTGDENARLLEACPDSRTRALVLFDLHTGLRRRELWGLNIEDINVAHRQVFVSHGKGGRQRVVPLGAEALEAVEQYLDDWPATEGPLFRSFRSNKRISRDRVYRTVTKALYDAGVKRRPHDGKNLHALRHTAASDVLAQCGRIEVVQEFLGHSSLDTTRRYSAVEATPALHEAVAGRRYRP